MKKSYIGFKKLGACVLAAALVVSTVSAPYAYVSADTLENGGNTADITADSDYIYINYTGSWSGYMNLRFAASSDVQLNALSGIIVAFNNSAESTSVEVYNDWYSVIDGAQAVVVNSGAKEQSWEGYESTSVMIMVPISTYENLGASALTLSWEGNQTQIDFTSLNTDLDGTISGSDTENIVDNKEVGETEITDTDNVAGEAEITDTDNVAGETEITDADNATGETEITDADNAAGEAEITDTDKAADDSTTQTIVVSGGIQVDGMYDDWNGLPQTSITYMGDNAECNHYGQLYTDGDTLYAHFKASDLYEQDMKLQIWTLTINGQDFAIQIQPEKDGNVDWNTSKGLEAGTYTNLKVFVGYGNNNECSSNVAYTIYDDSHSRDTRGDEIEFSLSLSRLSELTGIAEDEMNVITLTNPNLGNEGVSIAGSSTGPWGAVVIAFGISMSAYLAKRKKREE